MKCPYCHQPLTERNGIFICPQGHGALMAGKLLGQLKQSDVQDEMPKARTQAATHETVVCPHCGAAMQKVNYNNTGIIINACTNCPYRWLNSGEIKKIEEFKPNIHPQDLLLLENLQAKTEALAADTNAEDSENPEVPLYSGARGGLLRGVFVAGNDRRTLSYLLGAGMYSLIIGIFKSRIVRIIAPVVIVGFAILFYLIWKQVVVISKG